MPAPHGIRRTGRHRERALAVRLRTPPRPSVRSVPDGGALWRRRCTCPEATRSYASDEDRLVLWEYSAKHVTLSLALRSSGDARRGFSRDRATATLVARRQAADR